MSIHFIIQGHYFI